jgi:prevent-host-death family protein
LRYTVDVPKNIPQRDLRNENAKVIEAVADGETFIVTRNGTPVAELRPFRSGRRTLVPKAELLALAALGPHVDARQFREDIDRVVDQTL